MEGSSFPSTLTALFILLLFTSDIHLCSATTPIIPRKKNTEFIRASCGTTLYPRLCLKSLSSYASTIQKSPRLLAQTALSVTLSHSRSISIMMSKLLRSRGMKPREIGAMRDCIENISDSIDELRNSIQEMDHLRKPILGLQMNDIQTWVSAALTDEDTCMDGFASKAMNGKVKTMVRRRVVKVARLTSNALSLINTFASIENTFP